MTECREEQKQELEALIAVLDYGRVKFSEEDGSIKGSISIEFEPLSSQSLFYITENEVKKTATVSVFPPATLKFYLPSDYPALSPPKLDIECVWMSPTILGFLRGRLKEQCESMAGMGVLFFCCQTVVDAIKDMEEELREICLDTSLCRLEKQLSPAEILKIVAESSERSEDHNFKTACHDCEVCFENKMGKECLKLSPCGHIYCCSCIEAFIKERTRGSQVKAITCLTEGCDCPIPQTIILKYIGADEFERYERILLESALCQMKDVVTCPRPSCQKNVVLEEQNPKLGTCIVCSYSFCAICRRAYHGIAPCNLSTVDRKKIVSRWNNASEEQKKEMARLYGGVSRLRQLVESIQNENWIDSNSKPCPKCRAAIEKNAGCNKMICSKCKSPFCWLCDRALPTDDPYSHFREGGQCANRLFEGTSHDFEEDDFFFGGVRNHDDDDFSSDESEISTGSSDEVDFNDYNDGEIGSEED